MARITVVGEGMLELRRAAGGGTDWRLGHGGDTLNTAIHLARLGDHVRYFTALGDDPFSDDLRAMWRAEAIDLALVLTVPGGSPGLYAIETDADGERTFTYWRGESAARQTFSLPGTAAAMQEAEEADLLVYSLISLAILPERGRQSLIALAGRMRGAGKQVAFDGNYRPRLWRDPAEARVWRDRAIATCTIGLPTLEDEILLGAPPEPIATDLWWRSAGASETIVKLGADGCLVGGDRLLPPPMRLRPVDTSGAGDAFNAGYLDARLAGASVDTAVLAGHRLAGWTIMRPGAVPPRDDEDVYHGEDRAR